MLYFGNPVFNKLLSSGKANDTADFGFEGPFSRAVFGVWFNHCLINT